MYDNGVYVPLNQGQSAGVSTVNGRDGAVTLTKSDVGLSSVDNTSDQTKANTTTYSALTTTSKTLTGGINEVKSSVDSKAPTSNPTFTGTVVLPSTTSIGNISSTEISYLDGVTSAIQAQLNSKQPSDIDLTAIANLTSNGIIVKTGSGTSNTRSIVVTGEGLSLTNGDGILDNPTITSNATSSNTPSTIVSRNADGNFNASTITATLNGSASTLTIGRTIGIATGDVTSNGSSFNGSQNNTNEYSIGANKVTNAKMAQMPTMTVKGNDAVGSADPQDLTVSEVQTMVQDITHRFVTDSQISLWNSTAPAIKYYNTQADAITDASNISLGDKIQTFGGGSVNDGLGGLYLIQSTLSGGGFTIATGKHANFLNSKELGVGQSWQDVKASRSNGQTYTNTTGKPIVIATSITMGNAENADITVNGVVVAKGYASSSVAITQQLIAIVPSGSTYRVYWAGTIGYFAELR